MTMTRVLFSQLKVGITYYEYYTDSRDTFLGFDGYVAVFEEHIFFAYKKCKFYELIPFKQIVYDRILDNERLVERVDEITIDQNDIELRELEKILGF